MALTFVLSFLLCISVICGTIWLTQLIAVRRQLQEMTSDITILIEDNGIGIDPADLQQIFERLYKCDKGRSGKGSGLGLSIVRQLTEKMNGRIDVTSKPDHYTAFNIRFPAAED